MSKIYQKTTSDVKNLTKGKIGGFTLIELLVVVLIIGILAAIALPQYEKSVEKSRAAEAINLFGSLRKAEEMFFLNNQKYTRNLESLDLSMPGIGRNIGYGQNNWTTNNYYYWVDAEGFGGNVKVFKAKATPDSHKYILYMEVQEGTGLIWCGPYSTAIWPSRPAASAIPDICKAIAGNADGIISEF